jgi:hypothetical protein
VWRTPAAVDVTEEARVGFCPALPEMRCVAQGRLLVARGVHAVLSRRSTPLDVAVAPKRAVRCVPPPPPPTHHALGLPGAGSSCASERGGGAAPALSTGCAGAATRRVTRGAACACSAGRPLVTLARARYGGSDGDDAWSGGVQPGGGGGFQTERPAPARREWDERPPRREGGGGRGGGRFGDRGGGGRGGGSFQRERSAPRREWDDERPPSSRDAGRFSDRGGGDRGNFQPVPSSREWDAPPPRREWADERPAPRREWDDERPARRDSGVDRGGDRGGERGDRGGGMRPPRGETRRAAGRGGEMQRGVAENRCFVANLPYELDWPGLKDYFKQVAGPRLSSSRWLS